MNKQALTIIDNNNLRGVLAPSKVLPKKTLEDIIDFIELSSDAVKKETASRLKVADRARSWIPLQKVKILATKRAR